MTDSLANAEMVRAIVAPTAQAAASAAIREFVQTHPHFAPAAPKVEIPAPLKWAAAIVAGLMTMGVGAMTVWGVTTLNDLQITVAKINTRLQTDTTRKDVEEREGRYVNHPSDPNGATNWGITERVARANGYQGDMRTLPNLHAANNLCRVDDLPEGGAGPQKVVGLHPCHQQTRSGSKS